MENETVPRDHGDGHFTNGDWFTRIDDYFQGKGLAYRLHVYPNMSEYCVITHEREYWSQMLIGAIDQALYAEGYYGE